MAEQLTERKIRMLSDGHGNAIVMSNGLRDSSVLACNDNNVYRMETVARLPETQEAMTAVRSAISHRNGISSLIGELLDGKGVRNVNTAEAPLVRLCAEAKKQKAR